MYENQSRSLQKPIFPHRNTTVLTSSSQEILRPTHIHPSNQIRMPVQSQPTIATFNVPYAYTLVIGTSDDPLIVTREKSNGINACLDYEGISVTMGGIKGKYNVHRGPKGSAPMVNSVLHLLSTLLDDFQVNPNPNI